MYNHEYGRFAEFRKRIWCVCCFGKRNVDSSSGMNLTVNVLAETAEAAIDKVHEKFFNVKIVLINHKGQIDIE